jgi:Ca2+/Na+ antiporter
MLTIKANNVPFLFLVGVLFFVYDFNADFMLSVQLMVWMAMLLSSCYVVIYTMYLCDANAQARQPGRLWWWIYSCLTSIFKVWMR